MKTQAEILHENIAELSEKVDGFADAINTSLETVVDKTESIVVDLNQTYARLNEIDDTIANINTDVKVDVDLEELKEYIPEKTNELVSSSLEAISEKLDRLIDLNSKEYLNTVDSLNDYLDEQLEESNCYDEYNETINTLNEQELSLDDYISNIGNYLTPVDVSDVLSSNISVDVSSDLEDENTFSLHLKRDNNEVKKRAEKTIKKIIDAMITGFQNGTGKTSLTDYFNGLDGKSSTEVVNSIIGAFKAGLNSAKSITDSINTAAKKISTALNGYKQNINNFFTAYKDTLEDSSRTDALCCIDLKKLAETSLKIQLILEYNPIFCGASTNKGNKWQLTEEYCNNTANEFKKKLNDFLKEHSGNSNDKITLNKTDRDDLLAKINLKYEAILNAIIKDTDSTLIPFAKPKNWQKITTDKGEYDAGTSCSGFLSGCLSKVNTFHKTIHVDEITITFENYDSLVPTSSRSVAFYVRPDSNKKDKEEKELDINAIKGIKKSSTVAFPQTCHTCLVENEFSEIDTITHIALSDDYINELLKVYNEGFKNRSSYVQFKDKFKNANGENKLRHKWKYKVGLGVHLELDNESEKEDSKKHVICYKETTEKTVSPASKYDLTDITESFKVECYKWIINHVKEGIAKINAKIKELNVNIENSKEKYTPDEISDKIKASCYSEKGFIYSDKFGIKKVGDITATFFKFDWTDDHKIESVTIENNELGDTGIDIENLIGLKSDHHHTYKEQNDVNCKIPEDAKFWRLNKYNNSNKNSSKCRLSNYNPPIYEISYSGEVNVEKYILCIVKTQYPGENADYNLKQVIPTGSNYPSISYDSKEFYDIDYDIRTANYNAKKFKAKIEDPYSTILENLKKEIPFEIDGIKRSDTKTSSFSEIDDIVREEKSKHNNKDPYLIVIYSNKDRPEIELENEEFEGGIHLMKSENEAFTGNDIACGFSVDIPYILDPSEPGGKHYLTENEIEKYGYSDKIKDSIGNSDVVSVSGDSATMRVHLPETKQMTIPVAGTDITVYVNWKIDGKTYKPGAEVLVPCYPTRYKNNRSLFPFGDGCTISAVLDVSRDPF